MNVIYYDDFNNCPLGTDGLQLMGQVCVWCVCVRERDREREPDPSQELFLGLGILLLGLPCTPAQHCARWGGFTRVYTAATQTDPKTAPPELSGRVAALDTAAVSRQSP